MAPVTSDSSGVSNLCLDDCVITGDPPSQTNSSNEVNVICSGINIRVFFLFLWKAVIKIDRYVFEKFYQKRLGLACAQTD